MLNYFKDLVRGKPIRGKGAITSIAPMVDTTLWEDSMSGHSKQKQSFTVEFMVI